MKKTFLLILITKIAYILTQTCGTKDPKSLNDCIVSSSTNSICCYTKIGTTINVVNKNENKNGTLCIFVPRSQIFITPHIRSLDIGSDEGKIDIELDCGFDPKKVEKGEPYSYCGENPKSPNDCINNSTSQASCCYIQNPNGEAFCVLNNGIYNSNNSYFGINVVCKGIHIQFTVNILLFHIIIIIILFLFLF